MKFTIWHTNDIHSNYCFLKQVHHYLLHHRQENDLYFDSGDYADLQSSIVQADQGGLAFELLVPLNLSAMTLGNNELDLGLVAVKKLLASPIPLVSSNLKTEDQESIPGLASHRIIHHLGLRFLILGLAPFFGDKLRPDAYNHFFKLGNMLTSDPIKAIESAIKQQQGHYDFLIVLSHSGSVVDHHLLESFPEIDLVLGGHDHQVLNENRYSQSGKGSYLGKLTVTVEDQGIRIIQQEQIDLPAQLDPSYEAFYQKISSLADQSLSQPLAAIGPLDFKIDQECRLINFICDGLCQLFDCDFAMMHHGIAEESLIQPISRKSLGRILPSKLNPTLIPLTGQAILDAYHLSLDRYHILQSGKGPGFRGSCLGTLGFSHHIRHQASSGLIWLNGQLLDLNQTYWVATDDYLQRGTGYPSLAVADELASFHPWFIRDLIQSQLLNQDLYDSCQITRAISP